MNNITYVFGHKNPDTDSIVSSTAFAKLKNILGENEYIAARAGKLNPQTEYIYRKFSVTPPEFIPDLIPKVKYFMKDDCDTVPEYYSLWNTAKILQKHENSVIAVVDEDNKFKSLLHYNVFAKTIFSFLNPEHHLSVYSSIDLITNTLNAQPLVVKNEKIVSKITMIVGAATFESFKKTFDSHSSEKVVLITGDREDIQRYALENNVFALVLSGGRIPKKELLDEAKKKNTSVLVSAFDTASTSMLIAYSMPVSAMSDYSVVPVHPMDPVSKIKYLLHDSPSHALPVVDDENTLIGMISENDLLREPKVSVSLVDHNELSQAVDGIENYRIKEVIDHHRISPISTKYPITFINRPVGSTSTQVANMFREEKVSIPIETAELLLCGILSDTLILKSATTTETDCETAEYLSRITGLDIMTLGNEIIAAGSKIGNRSASEVISQDMKEYKENDYVFTVSQIEVGSTDEILSRKKEFLDELEITRRSHGSVFAALLVTDISSLSSIMLVAKTKECPILFEFPKQADNIYYLRDVVSRKKQLIPLLSELLNRQ